MKSRNRASSNSIVSLAAGVLLSLAVYSVFSLRDCLDKGPQCLQEKMGLVPEIALFAGGVLFLGVFVTFGFVLWRTW